jgi:phosphoribosylaminoimidazolecarboxamide formyltransferase/IMP cyclohydrolase
MSDSIIPIKRALISVFDKVGLIDLGLGLAAANISIIASGKTQAELRASGIDVTDVAEFTGQPEILGGRVKTLHPKIHGGILARRDFADDLATLERLGFPLIDLVVVNLYPFESTIARRDTTFADAIENIDIGGPALIRAAAKNHEHLAVLTRPDQYPSLLASIRNHGGTALNLRRMLALAAFETTAAYDRAIADYLGSQINAPADSGAKFPASLQLEYSLRQTLRYGENPHQKAAFYVEPAVRGSNLATARLRHGKELSYNNLLDLDSALRLVRQFVDPAACILKHNNPCGAAEGADLADVFERAYEGDPVSAFGGIVGVNRPVDQKTAQRMSQPGRFLEAIIAPGFEEDAFLWLTTKPTWRHSVRLVELGEPIGAGCHHANGFDLRRVEGGMLVQDWDQLEPDPASGQLATNREATEAERRDLAFAWKVCALVKSNAIVLANGRQIVGVGAGQMSRLDSVRIAVEKAGPRARGSVLASDAFFPFRDGPDVAASAGVTAIIQPGGSKRDDETVQACNEHGMAMILTGRRHFRH